MTLSDFIRETGVVPIAYKLKLDATTVLGWRDGKNCPRPAHLSALVKLSKGRLTHKEIIEAFVKAKKSQHKKVRGAK